MRKQKIKAGIIISLFAFAFIFTAVLPNFISKFRNENRSKAEEQKLSLSLYPDAVTVRPGEEFKVYPKILGLLETDIIASAILTFKFDPQKVHLISSVLPDSKSPFYLLKSTALTKANTDGIYKLFFGVKSKNVDKSAVINGIPLAIFKSTDQLGQTNIQIDISSSQVILLNGANLKLASGNSGTSVTIAKITPTPLVSAPSVTRPVTLSPEPRVTVESVSPLPSPTKIMILTPSPTSILTPVSSGASPTLRAPGPANTNPD